MLYIESMLLLCSTLNNECNRLLCYMIHTYNIVMLRVSNIVNLVVLRSM